MKPRPTGEIMQAVGGGALLGGVGLLVLGTWLVQRSHRISARFIPDPQKIEEGRREDQGDEEEDEEGILADS